MKSIPLALREHLAQGATTWCLLLRVECVGKWAGTVLGFTTLDAPLTYDDGTGALAYLPNNGFAPERIEVAADFGVDNTNLVGWVTDTGITEQQILAGLFDYATVSIYRVNYLDLSMGHEVVGVGTCGQTTFSANKWSVEFRSLMQQAKQTISTVYSLGCRAQFGDNRCGMPFEWTTGAVTAIGSDAQRMFTAAALAGGTGLYDLGVVEWLTGNNANADMEVDAFLTGGSIRLALPMGYAMQVGDTFRIRRDCDKQFATCKAYGNALNFRGEHLTPVADTALSVPGAYVTQQGSA